MTDDHSNNIQIQYYCREQMDVIYEMLISPSCLRSIHIQTQNQREQGIHFKNMYFFLTSQLYFRIPFSKDHIVHVRDKACLFFLPD